MENGRFRPGDKVVELVAEEYLAPLRQAGVDTLVLGCTHYPLLEDVLTDICGPGVTLVSASSLDKAFEGRGSNCEAAKKVGQMVAERAKAAGITTVVFDRGGYVYHGRVKALAEGAREGGLEF